MFFILRCVIKRLLSGRADKIILPPQKILVISTAKLGDMVCVTPVFRAIKSIYPSVQVLVMGNKTNQELLANNSNVDKYIVYDGGSKYLINKLKSEDIDFACLTSPNFKALAITYLSGIKAIVAPHVTNGKSPYETKSYSLVKNFVIQAVYDMKSYMPREYLKLLESIEIKSQDTKKYLGYSHQADIKAQNIFNNDKLKVGIILGVGNEIKLWPLLSFLEVTNFILKEFNANIIILGSEKEKKLAQKLVAGVKGGDFVDLSGKLNIDELKAVIANLDLVIGVDTGPIYIAEAFDIPTVDIVGPMAEKEQPPQGEFHKIVIPPYDRVPQLHIMDTQSYDYEEARCQAESISAEMVIQVLQDLIPKILNR